MQQQKGQLKKEEGSSGYDDKGQQRLGEKYCCEV